MLIVCPSCASTYSLTPAQLGAGRRLRCAACRHEWFATPPAADEASIPDFDAPAAEPAAPFDAVIASPAPSEAEPAAAPASAKRRAARPRPSAGALAARLRGLTGRVRRLPPVALVATAVVLVVAGAVVQRAAVVKVMPQTARLYAAVGMPVNLRGLEFRGVKSSVIRDGDQHILVVEGEVKAVAKAAVDVPRIQLSLRGGDGHELYSWSTDPPRPLLEPGEAATFRARLVAPPGGGKDVLVRFAERDPRVARH